MPTRCTFVEAVEVMPFTGATMRFRSSTGDEIMHFSCERSTAIRLARDIIREVERADFAELGAEIIPLLAPR